MEPWSDSNESNPDGVSPPEGEARQRPGFMDLEYRFSLVRFEPDDLLIQVSRLFPRLCFVLGWVAPANDEAASKFIQSGEVLEYWLSDSERESLRDDAYRRLGLSPDYGSTAPIDDDEALWADWEGDWAQLDTVVKYWDHTVAAALEPPPEDSQRSTGGVIQAIMRSACRTISKDPVSDSTTKSHRSRMCRWQSWSQNSSR